ncbi:Phage anti-repressor protein [Pasteurella testudinis DSM 23072]|uniref:Phage anti-repressor protein n=1 Tax=Pasteurella testudinis DSM 23072 TaxID=1122938 RepID=A0A1W1V2E6_9PAST|nr:antA/AntB antirepressor family protein [Pasteurella testudinis]SMB87493.1 Phage anti-repressor protein [Pasteurella testudinis DSM 23072]SUB50533.1 Phage anti-repressor protein [Pasteurella testudinis]
MLNNTALQTTGTEAKAATFTALLPIETKHFQGVTTHSVNARTLHGFLESKRDFTNWIKGKIDRYGFIQGLDFVIVENLSSPNLASAKNKQSTKARVQRLTDYHISLNMAKELCLVENNHQGKLARQYFINCEESLNTISPETAERLRLDWQTQRTQAKAQYNPMAAALKACLIRLGKDSSKPHYYINESKMLLSVVLGMSADRYRALHGITGDIRTTLNADQLEKLAYLEQADEMLLNADIDDFDERKQKLIIAFSNRFRRN